MELNKAHKIHACSPHKSGWPEKGIGTERAMEIYRKCDCVSDEMTLDSKAISYPGRSRLKMRRTYQAMYAPRRLTPAVTRGKLSCD